MTAVPSEMSDELLTEILASIDAVIEVDIADAAMTGPASYFPEYRARAMHEVARYSSYRRGPIAAELAARGLLVR